MASVVPETQYIRERGKPKLARDKETGLLKLIRTYAVHIDGVKTANLEDSNFATLIDYVTGTIGTGQYYDREYTSCFLVDQQITGEGNDLLLTRTFQELGAPGQLIEIGQPEVRTAKTGNPKATRQFVVRNPYYPHPNAIDHHTWTMQVSTKTNVDNDVGDSLETKTLKLRREVIQGGNVFSVVQFLYGDVADEIDEDVNIRSDCSIQITKTVRSPEGTGFDPFDNSGAGAWASFASVHWPVVSGRTFYLTGWSKRVIEDDAEEVWRYTFIARPQSYTEWDTASFTIHGRASIHADDGEVQPFVFQAPVSMRGLARVLYIFVEDSPHSSEPANPPYSVYKWSTVDGASSSSGRYTKILSGYLGDAFAGSVSIGGGISTGVASIDSTPDLPPILGMEPMLDVSKKRYLCGYKQDGSYVGVFRQVEVSMMLKHGNKFRQANGSWAPEYKAVGDALLRY